MTLAAGTRLGTYEIVAPLGAGGMGEVYRARDSKLEREVAIKVLPEHLTSDADALARFEREAKAVAALSHPNILAIHDFGKQNGVTYAVTELLEGETLRGKLDGPVISQRQAVDWALQISRGLSAAHGRGVIHRDLKPDNVFVTRDGHVKILDFGLAKREEVTSEEQTSAPTGSGHTAPGTVMGTMGYMSPEQLRGLPVDHRSDIFSFGAILYELLSGKKAFKRDTATDTIVAVLKEEPPELTETGRNISPALDHIVRHCLEKDRENRFQTAKDVAFALSEASSPTTTVTSGVQAVVAERSRGKTVAIAAVAFVVLAAAGLFLWKQAPKTGAPASAGVKRIAVLPFENLGAPEDDYFADGIADAVRGKLTSLPGVEVIARDSSNPYKQTSKTPQEIAKELDAKYLLKATVRWQKGAGGNRVLVTPELVEIKESGAPASRWQQPFDAALTDVFNVQSDIATKVAQALGVALGAGEEKQLSERPTQNLAAYDAFLRGEEAAKGLTANEPLRLRKAVASYEQAVALDPSFSHAWARLSMAYSLLYINSIPDPEMAARSLQAAQKAVSIAPNRPEGYLAVGNYERLIRRDGNAALEQYAKAQKVAPPSGEILGRLARAEMHLGRWDAAIENLKQAERLDPRSVYYSLSLGDVFFRLKRYSEARDALDRGLALDPGNLFLVEQKAMTFLSEGDLASARSVLQEALKHVEPTALVVYLANYYDLLWLLDDAQRELLLRLTPSAFDDDRSAWAICLAQAYHLAGDETNARKYAEEARNVIEEQLREMPNDDGRHTAFGVALAYLGRKDDAIREGRRGVELLPVSRSAYDGQYNVHQLARIYTLVGEPEKAIDQLEALVKMPYYLSPAWLKIDPNFDPLRSNPRFQKLVAGAK